MVNGARFTVRLVLPLLVLKLPVGLYVAETLWLAALRDDVLYVWQRLEAGDPAGHVTEVPETEVPESIVKLMPPVGTVLPDAGVTVAISVTDVP